MSLALKFNLTYINVKLYIIIVIILSMLQKINSALTKAYTHLKAAISGCGARTWERDSPLCLLVKSWT